MVTCGVSKDETNQGAKFLLQFFREFDLLGQSRVLRAIERFAVFIPAQKPFWMAGGDGRKQV